MLRDECNDLLATSAIPAVTLWRSRKDVERSAD